MDDSSKVWIARGAVFGLSTVAGSALIKAALGHGGAVWYVLALLATGATVWAFMLQMRYKAARKGESGKSQMQIEVEALAAYAAQQKQSGQTPPAQATLQPQQPPVKPPQPQPPQPPVVPPPQA